MARFVDAIRWVSTPPRIATSVTGLFILITIVWASVDLSFPQADSAKHLSFAFADWDYLKTGDWLGSFKIYRQYPPLVHLVGAVGALLFGPSVRTSLILENLVFVPALAAGCYGVAAIAFGRDVAPLAVIFALGTPLVIGLFHLFVLDTPEAAMVALSVWLLLLSDRWRRPGISALAGLAVALGLYTKTTFVFFVAGLIAMMFVRGGWRQWRGLLTFAAVALIVIEPWYFYHYNDLLGQSQAFTHSGTAIWYGHVPYPQPFTLRSLAWYGWALVNQQLLLPLTLMFLGGLLGAVVWLVRYGRRGSYIPELLAGGLVSWILVSGLNLDDPRYSLPALVYVAVLGTWWIGRLPRRPRVVATVALAGLFVFNTLQSSFGFPTWSLAIHTSASVPSPIEEWTFRVARPAGQTSNNGARLLALLRAVRAQGYPTVLLDAATLNDNELGGFYLGSVHQYGVVFGFGDLARVAGLNAVPVGRPGPTLPRSATLYRDYLSHAGAPPCLRVDSTHGLYFVQGTPGPGKPPWCPPGFG